MDARDSQSPNFREIGNARFRVTGRLVGLELIEPRRQIVAAADRQLTIWDPDGRQVGGLEHANVSAIALAPDGEVLFSAGYQGRSRDVRSWRIDGFEAGPRFEVDAHVGAMACGPDFLLLGIENKLRLVSRSNGAEGRTLKGHLSHVKAVAITQDGSLGASAGGDGKIKLHDLARGKVRHTLSGHASSLQFSNDGGCLLSAGWDHVALWDANSGELIQRYEIKDANVAVLHELEQMVAVGTSRGELVVLDSKSGGFRGQWSFAGKPPVTLLRCTSDGRKLAVGLAWGAIQFFDCGTVRPIPPTDDQLGPVSAVVTIGASDDVLSSTLDGTVTTWNIPRSSEQGRISCGEGVSLIGLTPDLRHAWLSRGEGERRLELWNLETKIGVHGTEIDARGPGEAVASYDGRRAAIYCNSRIRVYELPELVAIADFDPEHFVGALAFQRTGHLLTGTHAGRRAHADLARWEPIRFERIAITPAHNNVTALSVYRDGSDWVVSGGMDGALLIWDAALEPRGVLGEGGATIAALGIGPNNQLAVLRDGSFGPELELWDLAARSRYWKQKVPGPIVSGSGRLLAITANGTIILCSRRGTLLAISP